jgi:hypothetical protein
MLSTTNKNDSIDDNGYVTCIFMEKFYRDKTNEHDINVSFLGSI